MELLEKASSECLLVEGVAVSDYVTVFLKLNSIRGESGIRETSLRGA